MFFYISQKEICLYGNKNTFNYESILIKIYVNANVMNTQIFHLIKYDLNGHLRSQMSI